ncbi:MAG: hypothetical protein PHE61_07900 [Candidatus Omnitrophica bacterium]|nr:hypothetical protein [Candidatus Omnitrophota bacterium]
MKSFVSLLLIISITVLIFGCQTYNETDRLYKDQWQRAKEEVRPIESPVVYPLKFVLDVILYPFFIVGKWLTGTTKNALETGAQKGIV